MTQYKNYNKQYLETLTKMWENLKDLYKLTSNPGSEIYRVQSFVSSLAKQVVRVQDLTAQFAKAQEAEDFQELRRIKYLSEHINDEKAAAMLWESICGDYNKMVSNVKAEVTRELNIHMADELLEQAWEYRKQALTTAAKEIEIDL